MESSRGFQNLTILDQPTVPCAVVRASNIAMSELPQLFDPVFRQLPTALAAAGRHIVAPALGAYFRIGGVDADHASTDVAVGFPIDSALRTPFTLEGSGPGGKLLEVTAWDMPGGRIAAYSHRGGYDTLQDSWQQVLGTITERGLSPAPPFWEVYVTAPTPDADPLDLRTDLFVALAPSRKV